MSSNLTLDYVETTGPVIRVGLIGERRILEDAEESTARDLSGLLSASAVSVDWTGSDTVEVTFEDES